jgi:hypothetical protein
MAMHSQERSPAAGVAQLLQQSAPAPGQEKQWQQSQSAAGESVAAPFAAVAAVDMAVAAVVVPIPVILSLVSSWLLTSPRATATGTNGQGSPAADTDGTRHTHG